MCSSFYDTISILMRKIIKHYIMIYKVVIDKQGKILLPAKLRKLLKWQISDILIIEQSSNKLELSTIRSAIDKLQQDFVFASNPKNTITTSSE